MLYLQESFAYNFRVKNLDYAQTLLLKLFLLSRLQFSDKPKNNKKHPKLHRLIPK